MSARDIRQRELAGEVISLSDPEYSRIATLIDEAQCIIADMNAAYRQPADARTLAGRRGLGDAWRDHR